MRIWLRRDNAGAVIRGRWFCVRFPWCPKLFSERYGFAPGLRFLGFRFHTRPFE